MSKLIRGAVIFALLAIGPPAVAGEVFAALYDVYLGGLRAGELALETKAEDGRYEARGSFRTVGLVALFASTEMEVEVFGRLNGTGFEPVLFISREREGDRERLVRVVWNAPGGPRVEATPPYRKKPWSIRPEDQGDALDPLTALVAVLAPRPAEKLCDRRIDAFDGRYRFAFEIGPVERDDGRLVCRGRYLRVAGFKPKKMRSRNARIPFVLTFEPRSDGSQQVVRVDARTKLGRAVVRLRR